METWIHKPLTAVQCCPGKSICDFIKKQRDHKRPLSADHVPCPLLLHLSHSRPLHHHTVHSLPLLTCSSSSVLLPLCLSCSSDATSSRVSAHLHHHQCTAVSAPSSVHSSQCTISSVHTCTMRGTCTSVQSMCLASRSCHSACPAAPLSAGPAQAL